MRYPGDTGLVVVGLRAASGLIANYLYCASQAVFLCGACRWLLCGKLSRALLSGPWLITAEGITTRSQSLGPVVVEARLDSSHSEEYVNKGRFYDSAPSLTSSNL